MLRTSLKSSVGKIALASATLVVGASVTLLPGCSDDNSGTSVTPTPTPTPTGTSTSKPPTDSGAPPSDASTPSTGSTSIRVVHASPDAPKVDVYAAGVDAPLLKDVSFGDTSAYLTVPAGSYDIQLRAAPSKATDPVAFSTGALTLPAGAKITAVATGLLTSTDAASKFRIVPLVEGFKAPGAGKATVRVLHAGADAPTVGVDVGNDDPTKPELDGLARFASTTADGVALPAGQELQVGIAAGGKTVTAFTTPKLPEGAELFLIATGLLARQPRETDGFEILAVGPTGTVGFVKQNPTVFAVHGSPDAPSVDIFAGPAKIADDLSFGKISTPIQVPPGTYDLDFYAHAASPTKPTTAPVTTKSTGKLDAGQKYLAIATGFLTPATGKPAFQLAAFADGFATNDTAKVRLRVVHASPDAPAVDVGVVAGTKIDPVLVPNLAFPGATAAEGLSVAAGSYTLGVTPAGVDTTIVAKFTVAPTAGTRAFVIAAGALAPTGTQVPFRLFVVNTTTPAWSLAPVAPL